MTATHRLRRLIVVALIVALVVPTGATAMGTAAAEDATATGDVEYVVSAETVRASLLASASLSQSGSSAAAMSLAREPIEEYWTLLESRLEAANASLATTLHAELERAPTVLENRSASAYETYVREEVVPTLVAAEKAVVDASTYRNATFEAKVIRGLLERALHEYREAVANGTVTNEAEQRFAAALVERASARYETFVSETLSSHSNEEIRELFEHLSSAVSTGAAVSEAANYQSSLRHELAEYTGIRVEAPVQTGAIDRIEADLTEVLEAYEAGNESRALAILERTYLSNFEGVEGTLIQHNPELVEEIEAAFNEDLPSMIKNDVSTESLRERIQQLRSNLETAESILESQAETDISLGDAGNATTTASSTAATTSTTTQTSTPGFTFLIVAIALGATALALRRTDS